MAKTTRLGGSKMTAEEYDSAVSSGYVSPRIVRPEVGPMKRVKKGEEKSVGDSSRRSTKERASKDNRQTASQSKPAPVAENPSGEAPVDASLTGGAQTQTENQPSAEPKATKATGRKTPPRKAQRAPAGAEDEGPNNTKTANVRFTDDDF